MNEERIFSRNSITEIEQEVDPVEFCRCHQSFLVNLEHVEAIRRYELTLKGNRKVPVSKLRYDSTKKEADVLRIQLIFWRFGRQGEKISETCRGDV